MLLRLPWTIEAMKQDAGDAFEWKVRGDVSPGPCDHHRPTGTLDTVDPELAKVRNDRRRRPRRLPA